MASHLGSQNPAQVVILTRLGAGLVLLQHHHFNSIRSQWSQETALCHDLIENEMICIITTDQQTCRYHLMWERLKWSKHWLSCLGYGYQSAQPWISQSWPGLPPITSAMGRRVTRCCQYKIRALRGPEEVLLIILMMIKFTNCLVKGQLNIQFIATELLPHVCSDTVRVK